MRYFARGVSYLLHPLCIPVYFLLFIFQGDTVFALIPKNIQYYCYAVVVFTLLIMPLVSLPVFRHFHLIRNYKLEEKQERVYPILIAVGFAFLGFWLLRVVSHTQNHIVWIAVLLFYCLCFPLSLYVGK